MSAADESELERLINGVIYYAKQLSSATDNDKDPVKLNSDSIKERMEEINKKTDRAAEYAKDIDGVHDDVEEMFGSVLYFRQGDKVLHKRYYDLLTSILRLDRFVIETCARNKKKEEVEEKHTLTKDVKKGIDYIFGPSSEDVEESYAYISEFIKQ